MDVTSESKNALSQFLHSCSKARNGKLKELSYDLRCLECGAITTPVPSCECRGLFDYIAPGELAEWAVKTYPEKSDRALAEDFRIGHATVSRARATVSNETVEKRTAENPAVEEKRIGLDGKKRRSRPPGRKTKPPGVKQAQRSIDLDADTWEQVKVRAAAAEIPAAQFIGALLTATINPEIDLKTLSKTAQNKVGVAIRQHQKKLDREFELRVQAEVKQRNQKAFPVLDKIQKEAYANEKLYREFMQKQKKIMTMDEYTLVCSLLHPDSRISASEERLRRAFQMFEPKVFALTGEKKKNA